jgi:hypothetical protein
VLDAPAIPIEFASEFVQWPLPMNLTASSAGSAYLLAFENTFEGRAAVYAVNSAGVSSGPTHEATDTRAPALASDGSAHLLAYIASGEVNAKRFDVAGQPIDSSPLVLSSTSSNKDGTVAGWCGASYLVVWQDDRNGALDLFSSRARANGTVLGAEQPLITVAGDQKNAALAWNGQSCLLVWHDERSGSAELWAARVSSKGSVIGSAFRVSSGLTGEARVAWDGKHHVIVWGDGKAARVSAYGSVVDTTPFSIASGIANPVVASVGGGKSLVVYERSERVYARVISGRRR